MDAQLVRELFNYDPSTGVLIWRVKRGCRAAGTFAGCLSPNGRWVVSIQGRLQYRYRVAWTHYYGSPPVVEIDHVNGISSDDRITNLRLATRKQNCENLGLRVDNTSGARNVVWDKSRGLWKVQVRTNGKNIEGGRFDSFSDATARAENLRLSLFTHHRIESA